MGTLRIGNEVVVPLLIKEPGKIEPLDITANGTYEAPAGTSYNPVNVNIKYGTVIKGPHVNQDGKWEYPYEEWSVEYNGTTYDNNIELIPIDEENEEVVYYLYDCTQKNSLCCLRPYGNGIQASYGLCKDGVFTALDTKSLATGAFYQLWLEDFEFTTLVIKISATKLTSANVAAWQRTDDHTVAFPASVNSVLMRYGNLPQGSNITCNCSSLESDNIKNFAKKLSGSTLSVGNAYLNCYVLQRWRNDGWNVKNNYLNTLANVFSNCSTLIDVPECADFSGWVSSRTTSIASFFQGVSSWRNPINVSDWDLSGVTACDNIFYNCRSLTRIDGIETWTGGSNITRIYNWFSACYNLYGKLDLSNLTFGSIAVASAPFNNCYNIQEINLPDLDFSSATSVANFFGNCYSLSKITHGTIIPSTGLLTNASTMFAGCYSLKSIDFIRGWDLTNANIVSMFSYLYSLEDSRDIDLTGVKFPTAKNSYSSASGPFYNGYNMKYADVSWFDTSIDTNTAKYITTQCFTGLVNCVEYYPYAEFQKVNFSISGSLKLSKESLIRILNALPVTTTKLTLTMGVNLQKLTDEEKAIATAKGWTLA